MNDDTDIITGLIGLALLAFVLAIGIAIGYHL